MSIRARTWAPELDTVFEVLSERRRRYALYVLHRSEDGAMTIDRLAERVAEMEREDRPAADANGSDERSERIAEELRRRHLATLIDAGIVEYDERSETVCYHRRPALEEWLEHAEYKEGKHPDC